MKLRQIRIFLNSDERIEATLTQDVVGAAGLYGLTFGPSAAAYAGLGYASTHVKIEGQVAGGEFDGTTIDTGGRQFWSSFSNRGGNWTNKFLVCGGRNNGG